MDNDLLVSENHVPENITTSAQQITLREHLERLIKEANDQSRDALVALRRELDLVQKFTSEANQKAEKADVEWRKAANEWRGTYSDLVQRYATSDELKALEKALLAADAADRAKSESSITRVEERLFNLELEKTGFQGKIGGVIAALAFIAAAVSLILQVMRK